LKLALATKTIVFLGYSLADPDFIRLWKLVHKELGDIVPSAYCITLKSGALSTHTRSGLNVIETDATYFLKTLKNHLVDRKIMIPDSEWGHSLILGRIIKQEHNRLMKHYRIDKNPEMLFSAFYQDGVMHACGAITALAFSGKASHHCYISQMLSTYEQLQKERLRHRNYGDVAYIEGYMNGLLYPALANSNRKFIPRYFLFGPVDEIRSFAQYRKLCKGALKLHRASFKWAEKAAAAYDYAHGTISIHHRPFL
jgi:hypothetical protein